MRKLFLRSFVATGVLASAFLVADIDKLPPEGKDGKEEKPEPEMGKPGEAGKTKEESDHMVIHRQLEADGQANLKEIARLMEKIRNGLSQKQTGDSTQGDQREVVKKIQDLIEKIQKGCGKPG